MKPTKPDNVACIIFGHNFYKTRRSDKIAHQLVCKNCNHISEIDNHGNFDISPTTNKALEKTLRKFYILRRQMSKTFK
jgi:hypothetical protein